MHKDSRSKLHYVSSRRQDEMQNECGGKGKKKLVQAVVSEERALPYDMIWC